MLKNVKLAIAALEPKMLVRSKLVCSKPRESSGASVFATQERMLRPPRIRTSP